ncbi:MAG: hypothetical protein HY922_06735 [Elusimicrobia bacterium]|nr:hypothetical protein [Elusimicrobiota bacterium]
MRYVEERNIGSAITALRPLFQGLAKAKKAAAKLGIFTEERELLTCPKCELQEDVAMTGLLFVTVPSDRDHDTGLRFKKVKRRPGFWRCPACGSEFPEPGPADGD